MKDITKVENQDSSLKSVQVEKTVEYEADEGKIQEKVTVNYDAKGNAIDNAINTIKTSEAVHNAVATAKSATVKTAKVAVTLGVIGFVLLILAVMAGIVQ